MKAEGVKLGLMLAVVVGVVWAVRKGAGALAELPGAAWRVAEDAVNSVIDGSSVISDPAAGGFIKENSRAGQAYVPDYSRARDVAPLVAFFESQGNTAAARSSALAKGWTWDEISLAVGVIAQRNLEG